MKNVKSPTSRSYHEFLIESLTDSQEVADYIEIVLEEGSDEPRLLPQVLSNVMEAYIKTNKVSDSTQQTYQKLEQMLQQSNCSEIYTFVELLKELGFQIQITSKLQNL
jgi:DNA-binding phage protein